LTRSYSLICEEGGFFVICPNWLVALAVGLVFLFSAAGGANAEVRTLKIYHLHTREKAEIAYKKDGRYLPDGLKKLDYILRDWRRNEEVKIDPRLFDLLWTVYQKTGSHDYINVVCGYRAPETNAMLRRRSRGVARKSQHTLGKAIDFFIPGVPLKKLREIGLRMEVGGVGYYPTSGSPFVHMDVGNPRYWPRMSRQQLLALFPHGKTLYVPSDGKPLPGYEEALAAYKARGGHAPDVQVASGSSRHRGFFATLFGGGADEVDDNSDIQVASAKSTPAKPNGESGAVRVKAADQRETLVAALPQRGVPLPERAPRPEVDGGADVVAEAASSAQLALNVPLPSSRPDYTPILPAADHKLVVTDASRESSDTGADQVAALLSRERRRSEETAGESAWSGASVRLAAFLGARPSARSDPKAGPAVVAALSSVRPDYEQVDRALVQPAVNTAGSADKGGRLIATKVSASPRLALLERSEGANFATAIASGVRTTEKEARTADGAGLPLPKSVAVPVPESVIRWALQARPSKAKIDGKTARALAYNTVHAAPRIVYTIGFQLGDPGEDTSRFTGSAVTFLSVAKFDGTE